MVMVFKHFQHMYNTISIYFRWVAISWTKVLTHLSKTNAFYRRPSVISKSIFVDSQPPLPLFNFSIRSVDTLPGYNIEKGRGGRNVKIRHWKLTRWTKRVIFRRVSQLLLSKIVAGLNMKLDFSNRYETYSRSKPFKHWYSATAFHILGGDCYIIGSCDVIGRITFLMRMCRAEHVDYKRVLCDSVCCLSIRLLKFHFPGYNIWQREWDRCYFVYFLGYFCTAWFHLTLFRCFVFSRS